MIGQYEEGIITFKMKNVYGEDVLGIYKYHLTTVGYLDLDTISGYDYIFGGGRFYRVN